MVTVSFLTSLTILFFLVVLSLSHHVRCNSLFLYFTSVFYFQDVWYSCYSRVLFLFLTSMSVTILISLFRSEPYSWFIPEIILNKHFFLTNFSQSANQTCLRYTWLMNTKANLVEALALLMHMSPSQT